MGMWRAARVLGSSSLTLALCACGGRSREEGEAPSSDPVPVGEVPPCVASAPARLVGYQFDDFTRQFEGVLDEIAIYARL